ncbi:MAG: CbtB domain-containing protein [Kiloniellales bacterium]
MNKKPETLLQSSSGEAARRTLRLVPAVAAAFLGAFILLGVGFAGPSAIHNAAHDTRHAYGFPCH